MKHWGIVLLLCLGIVACSSDKKVAPKDGRITLQEELIIPKSKQKIKLESSENIFLVDSPAYNVQNKRPALNKLSSSEDWKISAAESQKDNGPFLSSPVIGKENVYTLDSNFVVRAHNRANGEMLWQTPLGENDIGLSLVKKGTQLIALSPKGKVISVNTDGKILWEKDFKTPFRNNPVLEKGNLYLLSSSNDMWVLDAQKGKEKWHYKTDAPALFLQQMGTPAVSQETVIVPFSTGIVVAFDKNSGSYLWEEDMNGTKSFDRISNIAQMSSSPVIDEQIVYLVGHANKTGAFDLKSGRNIWILPYGSQLTPIVNGNAIFILTQDNILMALNKKDGHLFWQTAIPEIKKLKGLYFLDQKIIVIGQERVITLNALNGQIEDFITAEFDGSIPVLAQDGWYYLRKNGKLIHQGQVQ